MDSMRSTARALVRGAGRSLAVSALLVGGATVIALPVGASGGVSTSNLVLHPVVGNSQFATVRGAGYEATLLAAEAKIGAGATSASPASGVTLPSWTPVGPQPEQSTAVQTTWGGANSGRVTGLAVTAGSSPTIYLAAAGGGVWSSSTGGASWATHTDSQPDIATGSVTVDPSNASYVYAGSGEANQCLDCYFGDGILESSNGGKSWTTVNPSGVFTGVNIGSIVVEPGASSISSTTVLAGTSQGLYVSTDGGVTWSIEAGTNWLGGSYPVTAVTLNTQTSPISIYAYVQNVGLEYSADNGSTWALSMSDPAAAGSSDFGAVALAPTSSATSTTVYLSVGSGNGYVGMYKSSDGGSTWTTLPMCSNGTTTPQAGCVPYFTSDQYGYNGINSGAGGDQSWYDNTIAVDPLNPNVIIAGGITAVESTDGGTNWTNLNGGGFFAVSNILFHPDFHALAFDSAGNLYMGNDGGVWEMSAANVNPTSGSPVLSYSNLNTNLDITQFYPGFSQNANASTILAGAQDNGTNLYTSPSTTWGEVLGGDGGGTAIDPNNVLNQLAFADGSLYSTTDGWQTAANETYLTPSAVKKYVLGVNWAPPVSVVPETSGSTIVLGGDGIYLNSSFTNNSAWSGPVGYTGDPTFQSGQDFISTLAYAPSNPQIIYAGWDDGTIEMSTDGGLSWTTIQPEQYDATTGSYLMVTHIAVDPANPYTIDVSQSSGGYLGLAYGGVYAGSGASIEQITATSTTPTTVDVTGNLAPGVPSSAVIPDGHGGLLAATDLGVFWAPTLNGASTLWTRVGTGLPNVQVMDIQLTSQGTLIAATHGRGVWTIPFAASSASSATVCTWVGGVGSNGSDWSVGANWSTTSGASCTQAGGPPAGAQLVFPATPANATVTWDSGTEAGGGGVAPATAYDSIVVEGSGYTFTDSNSGVGVSVSPTLTTPCGSGVGLCVADTSHVTWPLDVAVSTNQTFAATSGSTLSISGVVSGSADLTVGNATSSGAVSLSAVNTLSGTTTVAAGTFTVTGSETSSTVVVSAGSTFYGAGAVSAVQDNGGTVVPASGATSPATLTASNGAPFNWGTLGIVINGGSNSQLSVPAGSVALSGMSLNVSDLPVASPGSSYVLVALGSGATATGTFSGLAQNATLVANGKTLQITYPSQYAGSSSEGAVLTDVTGGTVSSAPTAVSATAGNASAAVSWSAPSSDGGSPITGYTVTATDATTSANSVADACTGSTTSTATSCTATGLTNGDSYTFTVTATNGVGTSSPSSPSNAVTPEATVPGIPTGVTALSGNASAAVSWSAPSSDGGSPITGYTVTATDATTPANSVADACTGSTASTATSCTATGLTNGDDYTITVAAINAVGTGSPSAGVSVTPAGVPSAPGAVTATAGVTSISVTWSAPSANGSAIVGYYAVAQAGASPQTATCSTSLLSCVLTGLTPDVSYTVEVQAINGVGAGPFASSNAVTPYTVPGAPTGLSGTAGNAQVSLTWSAPSSDGGSAITGYEVQDSTNGGSTWTTLSANTGSTTTSYSATGLTNGTAYVFQVAAINAVGTGAFSTTSSSVTPVATVPGAPTGLSGTAGNAQVSLTWSAPSSDGGSAITGYEVSYGTSAGSLTSSVATGSTSTSYTVTGLTNGTPYYFAVAAINAVGTGAFSTTSSSVTPYVSVGVGGPSSTPSTPVAPPPSVLPFTDFGAPVSGSVSCSAPAVVAASSNGAQLGAEVSACALAAGSTVSLYPVTLLPVGGAPGVPSGGTLSAAGAITWSVPSGTSMTPSPAITLTITDASISAGDTIYAITATGLVAVGTASAGVASLNVSAPEVIVVIHSLLQQSSLVVGAARAAAGSTITLSTSGGSGSGAVTFALVPGGTASGCALNGSTLSAQGPGTCLVQATKAADRQYESTTSTAVAEDFVTPPLPRPLVIGLSAGASALSAGAQRAVRTFGTHVKTPGFIIVFAYGSGSRSLAQARANAAVHALRMVTSVRIRVVLIIRSALHRIKLVARR